MKSIKQIVNEINGEEESCSNDDLKNLLTTLSLRSKDYNNKSVAYIDNELHDALKQVKSLISKSGLESKIFLSDLISFLIENFVKEYQGDFENLKRNSENKYLNI